jgi:two-component system, NarL family, nitrate/nitrite response regulator NarL
MPNNRFSVFVVAENRLLREALARLLTRRGDFDVSGVSACVTDTTSSIVASGAEVLILDSVTARLSDCSFVSQIVNQVPNMKVVLVDMENDPEVFLECVRAGAVGYILKDASAVEVVSGVQAVAQGQAVCPPHLCLHLFRAFSRQWPAVPSARIQIEFGLTRRQQQIVPLIAQGLTNKEIASHLSLSEQTVKNHIHGIMRRVGADDRLQVIDLTCFNGGVQ